ncbi:nickel-dependent lactate racemase [Candidatus Bipolaricaulota bacterium]|nr:nickel-dependent lactate racemase [Candidatus Bipolaricaulota bacterium]
MEIGLNYGKEKVYLEIPKERLVGIYLPSKREEVDNAEAEIERALSQPIGSEKLEALVSPTDTVAIVVEDLTRPVPTSVLLSPLIRRMSGKGVPPENIKVVVALGVHRRLSPKEKRELVGELDERIEVLNHDPYQEEKLVRLGKSSYSGTDVYVNKTVAQADIKILTGDIEPHQLFGYGGGAKNVLPGIADAETIRRNHSKFVVLERIIAGELDNPLRREAKEAARMLGIDFILNVVLNEKKKVVRAFAGDVEQAFLEGVKLVDQIYKVQVPRRVDMVIVSCGGYPKDINLYQAQKAVENGLKMVNRGGKIILVAECREGWGSDVFYRCIKEADSMEEVIKRTIEEFVIGGHKAYQFAKAAGWARLFIYSGLDSAELDKFITPVSLKGMEKLIDEGEEIGILPVGSTTIPVIAGAD